MSQNGDNHSTESRPPVERWAGPKRNQSMRARKDEEIAHEIFQDIAAGGERIKNMIVLAFLGGAFLLAVALWQSGILDPK